MKAFRRLVILDWFSSDLGGKRRHYHRRLYIFLMGWVVIRWSLGKGVLKDQLYHILLLCQETRVRLLCFLFLWAGVELCDRIVGCP